MSTGFARLASRGQEPASASRVSSLRAAAARGRRPRTRRRRGSRGRRRSSAPRRGGPRGSGWRESSTAASASSSSESAWITPAWPEERLDGRRRAGERGGVRAGGALAGAGAPALHREDRLLARDAARDPARTCAGSRTTRGRAGSSSVCGVVLPVLEQVVRRDVGLVADRDERREPEAARGGLLEEREPERAALRREADVAGGERCAARRSRSGRARRTKMPRQFGPISRAPCARTRASSCSWRRAPSAAGLGEAGRDHAERLASPSRSAASASASTRSPGTQKTARSTALGDVRDRRIGLHARDRRSPSG